MRIDTLRLVGSAQTNRAMEAELVRIAGKTVGARPPAPKRDGTGHWPTRGTRRWPPRR